MILPNENEALWEDEWWSPLYLPGVKPIYIISIYGRVYNLETNRFLPQDFEYCKNKYITISLGMNDGTRKCFQVHRLVMMSFRYIHGCEELLVNHLDGVKYHNWLWNLEWATPVTNAQHAVQNNLIPLGEDRSSSVLTNEQVHQICQLIADGKSNPEIMEIMKLYHCDLLHILKNIRYGYSWKHISRNYNFDNMRRHFNESEVRAMCEYLQKNGRNVSSAEMLSCIGVDYYSLSKKEKNRYCASLCDIRNRNTFKDIIKDYEY